MSSRPPSPGSELLRALTAAALREGDPAELAGRAAAALQGVFQRQKNLVFDVSFTGFLFKGKPLGGADPVLLRAAGQLIVQHVSRIGFTPDAAADDLRLLFEGLAKPAALGEGGIVGWLRRKRPHGIYLSTSTGVYRPPAKAKPVPADTSAPVAGEQPQAAAEEEVASTTTAHVGAGETVAPAETSDERGREGEVGEPVFAAGGFMLFDDGGGTELSEFELIDEFPAAPGAAPKPAAAAGPGQGGDPGSNEMFHFFRAVQADRADEGAEKLPELLHSANNPTRFDELAEAAARAALRLVRSDMHAQAVELLDALVAETERPDRTRIFRDSAVQALRRMGTGETLQHLADLLQHGGQERERILRFFTFIGGDAIGLLETMLFRTPDPELRVSIFRHLMRVEGVSQRISARAMTDPSPARTRIILELVGLPEVDREVAVRWLNEAAGHADSTVRMDAAKHAAVVGGRGGLRILLDLLNNDRDPLVKRAAINALGMLGDPAAVPFLARVAGDGADEEVQIAAIGALGRIGSPDALPALLGVVNKRGLFGTRKLSRVKSAAVAAMVRIHTPAAREVIHSLAGGKDPELAAEAQRVLGTFD